MRSNSSISSVVAIGSWHVSENSSSAIHVVFAFDIILRLALLRALRLPAQVVASPLLLMLLDEVLECCDSPVSAMLSFEATHLPPGEDNGYVEKDPEDPFQESGNVPSVLSLSSRRKFFPLGSRKTSLSSRESSLGM